MTPETVVEAARSLRGARWRHRGRQRWAVDCLGLLDLSFAAAGRILPTPRIYGREPWDDQLRRGLREEFGGPVDPPWQPGDVALIRWHNGEPSHVGILGDHPHGLSLIHSHNLHGVVEIGLSGPYLKAIVEVYRPAWHDKFYP